jgi:hypothetical protein
MNVAGGDASAYSSALVFDLAFINHQCYRHEPG